MVTTWMVRTSGHYLVVTPVKGYLRHGFHTFHPRFLTEAFNLNGFETKYVKFSSADGEPLERPDDAIDSLIWIVGQKTAPMGDFQIPQQLRWIRRYERFAAPS